MTTFDERSERNIATLLPAAQAKAREFLAGAIRILEPHGLQVRIIAGTRTFSEQDALYAKGRTAPGPKVTNARGGYSWHNFGIAWDVGIFRGREYLGKSPFYDTLGKWGESLGIEWGGAWRTFKDTPHYQLKTGKTLAQARADHAAKRPIV